MENQTDGKRAQNEEVDMGLLVDILRKGFQNLFKGILNVFLYLKRNMIKLGILLIVGLGVGFGLNQIVSKELKTEIIVKPNANSKIYLYDVVEEINANLKSKHANFFEKLEIDVNDLDGFSIEISPVEEEEVDDLLEEVKYLELLEKLKDEEGILEIVRSEIQNKSVINHRLIFYYKDADKGRDITNKLVQYINSNPYYNDLVQLHIQNAEERIGYNNKLILQIDEIISGYTTKLGKEESTGTLVLSEEESLNVPGLLRLKNDLIKENELKKLEIQGNKEAIRIVSFGSTQEVIKTFFGKTMILVPTILIVLFLLWDFGKYLNRKSKELQMQ